MRGNHLLCWSGYPERGAHIGTSIIAFPCRVLGKQFPFPILPISFVFVFLQKYLSPLRLIYVIICGPSQEIFVHVNLPQHFLGNNILFN